MFRALIIAFIVLSTLMRVSCAAEHLNDLEGTTVREILNSETFTSEKECHDHASQIADLTEDEESEAFDICEDQAY